MPESSHVVALAWLAPLSPAFGGRAWRRALVLVAGALLAQGPRAVAPALRAAGLGAAPGFSPTIGLSNRASPVKLLTFPFRLPRG